MRCRRTTTAFAVASALVAGTGVASAEVVNCAALVPSSDPSVNYTNIQTCLDTVNVANLTAGTFVVSRGVVLGDLDQLTGAPSTLRLAAAPPTNYLVKYVGSNATVSSLTIDAAANLGRYGIIVWISDASVTPNSNTLQTSTVTGGANPNLQVGNHPETESGPTTISIDCATCTGNRIAGNDLTGNYRVVVFHGSSSAAQNVVEDNQIHDNQCDAADFPGYGVLRNNNIYENGGYCAVGRGGGLYADDNSYGGLIEGNDVRNTCGHNLDLIRSRSLLVRNNTFSAPGTRSVDPNRTFCGGATAMSLIDVRGSTVEGNTAKNQEAPWNKMAGFTTTGYQDTGATSYSDLPAQGNTIIAFQLKWSKNTTWTARSNNVNNNTFLATCAATDCLGLSMFTSRGTGYYSNGTHDSASWNKFEGNRIYGSEYRTVRGGRNWWAGNNSDPTKAGDPDPQVTYCDERTDWALDACNDDDYRHNPPVGSTYRNDLESPAGTQFYVYS